MSRKPKESSASAMISAAIDLAVSNAIHREHGHTEWHGLMPEDIIVAVNKLQAQNKNVLHDLD